MHLLSLILSVFRAQPGGQLQTLKTHVGIGIPFTLFPLPWLLLSGLLTFEVSVLPVPSSPRGLVQWYQSPEKPALHSQW